MKKTEELLLDYLDEIEYEEIEVNKLTEDMLHGLEAKRGYLIRAEYPRGLCFFINRQVEGMAFLNQVVMMEKVGSFNITDSFGISLWTDAAEGSLEFLKGLTDENVWEGS